MKNLSFLTAAAATIACGLTLHGDVIEINQAGFAFSPNDTSAAPGDTLRFSLVWRHPFGDQRHQLRCRRQQWALF